MLRCLESEDDDLQEDLLFSVVKRHCQVKGSSQIRLPCALKVKENNAQFIMVNVLNLQRENHINLKRI